MDINTRAVKGNIVYAAAKDKLCINRSAWLICENGLVQGICKELPQKFAGIKTEDFGDRLIVPGFVDLHTHAPQYAFRGTGMDLQLLEWLNTYTFPEEAKYNDLNYAERAYSVFADDLKNGVTTRAMVFGTVHIDATLLLMQLIEKSGIKAYVGKVNMDRNCPAYICEGQEASIADTEKFIEKAANFKNVKPILTPRFTPSCTDETMAALGRISKRTGLYVQTHLSENKSEIAWVRSLCPQSSCYADTYRRAGLLGSHTKTILAHCVHPSDGDMYFLKRKSAFVAHCPQSNINLCSGAAPVRRFLDEGINCGIGTDCAGGSSLSMLRAVQDAIMVSKLRYSLLDNSLAPLNITEAFYLATKGGGEFFKNVGSFENGYEFDAVVLSEENLPHPQPMTIENRLERLIYLADERAVKAKYVSGIKII